MIILFDLDGTLGNLYGRKDWLEKLTNEEPIYEELEPLVDMEELNIIANKLITVGIQFGVITWLSNGASETYELITSMEKYRWCKKHIPFITEFECQPYGTPKQTNYHNRKCILIDDNAEVREDFETPHRRKTFDANDDIIAFLTNLYNDFCANC
jgi:hypothetical protein